MENTFFALVREIQHPDTDDVTDRYEALHGRWNGFHYVNIEVGVFDGVFMLCFYKFEDADMAFCDILFNPPDIENLAGFSIKKFITKTEMTIREAKE